MLPFLILGICVLAGAYLLGRWFVSADPKALVRSLKIVGVVVAVCIVFVLAVSGRLGVAIAAAGVLLPIVMRWRALANRVKAARGPSSGLQSTLRTAYLDVALDHDSGAISGTVLSGIFAGRPLSELSMDELKRLHEECLRADPQSAPIVAAFLDRTFGSTWRDEPRDEGARGRSNGPMTREEAFRVLGLSPEANEQEIREAHHRLMKKLHPDQGGSDYLAAKLNEAKDVLLG